MSTPYRTDPDPGAEPVDLRRELDEATVNLAMVRGAAGALIHSLPKCHECGALAEHIAGEVHPDWVDEDDEEGRLVAARYCTPCLRRHPGVGAVPIYDDEDDTLRKATLLIQAMQRYQRGE